MDELDALLVAGGDLVWDVGVGGEDDRDAPAVEHLEQVPGRVDLAYRLAQARRVHVHDDARLGHGVGGLFEHRGDVALGEVAEDLYEVGVTEDLEAPGEGRRADV